MKYTFDMVKDLRAFRDIDEADFKTLLQTVGAFTKKIKKGGYITLADEEVPCVSVILKGTVHMMSEDIWGNRSICSVNPLRAVRIRSRWLIFMPLPM